MIVLPLIGWFFALLCATVSSNKQAILGTTGSRSTHDKSLAACFSSRNIVTIRHDDNGPTSSSKTKKDRVVSMNKLRVGDYVRTARTVIENHNHDDLTSYSYSRVYSFGQYSNYDNINVGSAAQTMEYEYLQLYTRGGTSSRKPLEISRSHLIYIVRKEEHGDDKESCSATSQVCAVRTAASTPIAKLVPTSTVTVGDLVFDGTTLTPVIRIGSVNRTDGAYAPFTESGSLLVNGIAVSSYYLPLQKNDPAVETTPSSSFEMVHWWFHLATAPRRWVCLVHWDWCINEHYTDAGVSTTWEWISYLQWVMLEHSIDIGMVLLLFLLVYLHFREADIIRQLVG